MNFDSVRAWLASVVADLRERRLLPVIALLIAAAIVLPIVLSKSGKAENLAALPAPVSVTSTAPSLGTSTPSHTEPAQNYLTGPGHDPFIQPRTTTTAAASTVAGKTTTTSASGGGTAGAGATTTSSSSTPTPTSTTSSKCPAGQTLGQIGGKSYCLTICHDGQTAVVKNGRYTCVTPSTGTRTTTATTTKTVTTSFSSYAADVTFGPSGQTGTVYHHLARFELLPDDQAPAAEFLGVEASDRRTAVFWVSGAAKVTGGARCSPSAAQCSFVSVKPGGAFYLDLSSAQGGYLVYRVMYDSVTKLTSNGSYPIDAQGQRLVDEYKNRLSTLQSLRYSSDTGLMSIDLGTSEPTAHLVRPSTGASQNSQG